MSKSSNPIANPHDQFFRKVMKDKRVARDFLIHHLPRDLCQRIDLNVLELQPRSFANDVGRETTIDVLFKTKIDDQDGYIYLLLEHQSSPDKLMPFRMLKYTCNIIDEHLKKSKQKPIPLVYP